MRVIERVRDLEGKEELELLTALVSSLCSPHHNPLQRSSTLASLNTSAVPVQHVNPM